MIGSPDRRNLIHLGDVGVDPAMRIDEYVEAIVNGFAHHAESQQRISDVLVSAERPPRLVVNGRLMWTDLEATPKSVLQSAVEHLSPRAQTTFDEVMDASGRFTLADGSPVRMHLFKSDRALSGVFRLQPPRPFTWPEMNLPDQLLEALDRSQGFILFSGPVGSRKTAAANAMIDYLNDRWERPTHILTIEDPPEFTHEDRAAYIHQREIGFTAADYLTAIYGALRARPNVIFLGELRDASQIEACLMAASLGRLAISTIHSETTYQTISRITQAFPDDRRSEILEILKAVLICIVSLRAVPGVDGQEHLAYEILWLDKTSRNLLDELDQLRGHVATGENCVPMSTVLNDLVHQGRITRDEALRHAHQPDEIT